MKKSNFIGKIGEKIARKFFLIRGYQILEKNYKKRNFEIDLIVKKKNEIHFIEVKTVIFPSKILPQELMKIKKIKKIKKGSAFFLLEKGLNQEKYKPQIDFLGITLFPSEKKAKIKWLKNLY